MNSVRICLLFTCTAHSDLHKTLALPPQAGSSKKSSTARSKPYSKSKQRISKQIDHGRNKFEPVSSFIMPPSLPAWVEASRKVGEHFHDNQSPRKGVLRGYLLPDPCMLGAMSPKLSQPFLKMYLKLRRLLHYRLRKIGVVSASLSNAEWRKILGLGTLKETAGTKSSEDRVTLVKILQQTSSESGWDVDFTKLDNVIPEWEGQQFEADLPTQICREILDEIIHLSFKSKLLLADRFLYKIDPSYIDEVTEEGQILDDLAAVDTRERSMKVATLPGVLTGHMGFSSPNPASCQ
ncbi:hypothetical protein F5878DRAFT_665911 [Lentinula raphanica]|uniref:Uncharacterized protein n=1 Tax=Lentinula raphanica TaxID=153919 RepID=A0AA38U6B2_9AGAR|nr:hypothetical protein F5878DRAFT_665911 [Lentinula raphanica]